MVDNEERRHNRRRFMNTAIYSAGLAALSPACFLKMRDPGEPAHVKKRMNSAGGGPEPLPPTREYPSMPRAVVGMRGVQDSIEEAVREAVEAAGGLAEIERGQRVVIKPNMCGPAIGEKYPGRITTNPEVLRAVIRLVKARGAEAIVGDRAMVGTELAFTTSGFARVCREEGAVAFPWNRSEYVRVNTGKRHWSQGYRIPKILLDADHLINLPLLKSHDGPSTQFTCCLKAYVGVLLPLDRWQEGPDALHTNNFGEKIAEVHLSVKPTINIVDATTIMVRGGPDGLKKENNLWIDANLIMASKDRVACDSVALSVLKRYGAEMGVELPYVDKSVWDHSMIYYSAELGVGQADPANITIEDIKVPMFDEFKDNWA